MSLLTSLFGSNNVFSMTSIRTASELEPVLSAPSSFDGALPTHRLDSYDRMKRVMDVVLAVVGIILLAPLFLITALSIKLTSKGPVIFVQTRVGKAGRQFACYKFRSMVVDAEHRLNHLKSLSHHADPRTFKVRRDPRLTKVGMVLRKCSIDELPQLWNVLKGDMSIVGPRPPLPREVVLYSLSDRRRLDVRPGLTCVWQVSGRGDIPFARQVELDVEYIEQRNLLLDLKLIALTIPAVVMGKGAY
jgi:lipopolysaccharide/colanic/teichoic acid biosynthesis glycosyltransferase